MDELDYTYDTYYNPEFLKAILVGVSQINLEKLMSLILVHDKELIEKECVNDN